MMQTMVYSFLLLLVIIGCAKRKQGVTCANPDPATGACLRDDNSIYDPDDEQYSTRQPYRNNRTGNTPQQQQAAGQAGTQQPELGTQTEGAAQVNTSKVPAVTLMLTNENNTGVRPTFSFTHVTGVGDVSVSYGGEGQSHVFNDAGFTDRETQLKEVAIPIRLSFTFNGTSYCATTAFSSSFDKDKQQRSLGVDTC